MVKKISCITGYVVSGLAASVVAAEPLPRTFRDFVEHDNRHIGTGVIKQVDDSELVLMVCKPDGWEAGQQRTGMVWVHGGGWVGGHPDQWGAHMRYCAARGAVAFGVQYRLMKPPCEKAADDEGAAAKFDEFMAGPAIADCIEDCADAVRYIRANADALGVDPEKLVSIGDSAGAHLAASLGTCVPADARANAVVACSSISDLTYKFGRDYIKPSPGFEGRDMEEDPERLAGAKAVSPVFNIHRDGPPFLIIHGTSDWLGDEPKRFYDALTAAGVDAEYIEHEGARHAFIVYGYTATIGQITRALLDIDAFLAKRGFLQGESMLRMPSDDG